MITANSAETCPINHEEMKWLWEHNKPILDELREVVEPLVDAASTHMESSVAEENAVFLEAQRQPVFRGAPFGEPYEVLPPRLFGSLAANTAAAPKVPHSNYTIARLVHDYSQRRSHYPDEGMVWGKRGYEWSSMDGNITIQLTEALRSLRDRGIEIDPARWEQYKQVGRSQIYAGRYDLDVISARRAESIERLYTDKTLAGLADATATGAFEQYMLMRTDAYDVGGKSQGLIPVGYLFMPVGAYGADFAEKLLRTTAFAVNDMQRSLQPLASLLVEGREALLRKHTARGDDGKPLDAGLVSMVQEGARSIMEAVALLTADKVEGFSDPDVLFQAIVEQEILEQFTRVMPMGVLGPIALSEKYFPDILQHVGGGKLRLNPEVMAALKRAKLERAKIELGQWVAYWSLPDDERAETQPPFDTSLICPAAMPHGAIRRLSSAMLTAQRMISL